jgi:hypothetical protein
VIENRPLASFVSHLTLVIGVLVIGFPLYLTFVASKHTAEAIVQNVPMPLLPGDNFLESYRLALFGGQTQTGGTLPAVLNADNEVAVEIFLAGDLPFAGIGRTVEAVMAEHDNRRDPGLEAIMAADLWARDAARRIGRNRV